MKYPRLPREKRRNCKLTDDDIFDIREKHRNGISKTKIAKEYNVSYPTIFYWCLSDKERADLIKKTVEHRIKTGYKYIYPKEKLQEGRKYRIAQNPEIKKYEIELAQKVRKQNPEMATKASRKYMLKHRKKLYEKNRLYRIAHREELREYAREYRKNKKLK